MECAHDTDCVDLRLNGSLTMQWLRMELVRWLFNSISMCLHNLSFLIITDQSPISAASIFLTEASIFVFTINSCDDKQAAAKSKIFSILFYWSGTCKLEAIPWLVWCLALRLLFYLLMAPFTQANLERFF